MEQNNNSNHNIKFPFDNNNLENSKNKKPFVILTKKNLEEEENKLIVIDTETKKKCINVLIYVVKYLKKEEI